MKSNKFEIETYNGKPVRHFDHRTTWQDVTDMTFDEALFILSRHANSDGKEWSARPQLARACQIALIAIEEYQKTHSSPPEWKGNNNK